jgi:hypothetical protein
MSVVNLRDRTIQAKVVYYGPPLGGKTTSLRHVHRVMDPEGRTNLISLNTDKDRTLFFDFLPLSVGRIGDFTLKIQGFTVPGQVKYLLTRRYVLRGADAIVFVADSREAEAENGAAAWRDLKENLAANGLDYASIPLVLQYNKRDEPGVLAVEALDRLLNDRKVPAFETVATTGAGVFEAFASAAASMVERICADYRIAGGKDVALAVRGSLARIQAASAAREAPAAAPGERESRIVLLDERPGAGTADDPGQILEKALAASMRVAELLTEVQTARTELEARVGELSALNAVAAAAAASLDEDRVVAAVVEGASAALGVSHASILLRDEETGGLRERGVHGFLYDPVVAGQAAPGAAEALAEILSAPGPVAVTEESLPALLAAVRGREPGVHAAAAAPLRLREETRGLLVVYGTAAHPTGPSALRFLGALASAAVVYLENARLHGDVERANRELEGRVAARTAELEKALAELRQLDQLKEGFLSSMSHELMTPLAGIRSSAEILRTYPDMEAGERAGFVQGIEHEAARLTDRLQDILDLSALDAGRVRLETAPAIVKDAVRGAIARTAPAFEARRVRVAFHDRAGQARAAFDARWFGRALDHVLGNAAKFSPEDAEATVTLDRDGPSVRITVLDRGPGIVPEERESLFRRFKQLGQVLTDKTPGLGAGLPLVRRIVEAHGGTVALEGGPGIGTGVVLRLPAA